jgi:G3E family GTPase
MKFWSTLPVVFITLATLGTAAFGQKIYRCGSEYSQVPCANAIVVEADDARSAAQKVQSDAMIQRNTTAARAMETTRLKEETELRSGSAGANESTKKKKHKASPNATSTASAAHPSETDGASEGKKAKKASKKKEPDFFTARVTTTPEKDKRPPKK